MFSEGMLLTMLADLGKCSKTDVGNVFSISQEICILVGLCSVILVGHWSIEPHSSGFIFWCINSINMCTPATSEFSYKREYINSITVTWNKICTSFISEPSSIKMQFVTSWIILLGIPIVLDDGSTVCMWEWSEGEPIHQYSWLMAWYNAQ